MSDGNKRIECKVTKWFVWRALLMLLMFGFFGAYFLYDWKVGYPEKNVIVAHYKAFEEAEEAWTKPENKENWEEFAADKTIPFEEDKSMYPAGTEFGLPWPESLRSKESMQSNSIAELWNEYAGPKMWPSKVNTLEDIKPREKIDEQLWSAGICGVLSGIALFFFLRTRGRSMSVDEEAYYAPGGEKVPFKAMRVIDKRKWATKGLAYITYEDEGGAQKKAKVDGMVYGQFKAEEGAPAEALFQQILANFEGEIVDVLEDEDDEAAVDKMDEVAVAKDKE